MFTTYAHLFLFLPGAKDNSKAMSFTSTMFREMCTEPGGAARVNFNGFFPLYGLVGQNSCPLPSLAGDQVATQLNFQHPGPEQVQRCMSVSCPHVWYFHGLKILRPMIL